MLWIEWSVSDDPRSRLTSCSFLFGSMQLAFYGVRALIAARTQPWCLRSVCFHVLGQCERHVGMDCALKVVSRVQFQRREV